MAGNVAPNIVTDGLILYADAANPKSYPGSGTTWNDISYIGRSEYLHVFHKFKRQVAFGFQIPCFNIVELRERHRALGALESSLAGKYNGNKLGGILTRLYFGNYLKGETGIINNISYDIPNESSWDIDEKLAHNINVSVNFTVIHNELPTYQREGGFFNKTIANGANYFISSEQALIGTGATTDAFNEKIPNYFTDVNRVNNFTLIDQGNNKPAQAILYSQDAYIMPLIYLIALHPNIEN